METTIPGLETPQLTLKDFKTVARVVDIVDGDTIYVVFKVFDRFYKFNTRILGIDTCEKHGENMRFGLQAKEFSYEFFTGMSGLSRKQVKQILEKKESIVTLECDGFDKYGRLLANVFYKDRSIAEELKSHHLAYSYKGKKKLTMEEQRALLGSGETLEPIEISNGNSVLDR